MMQQMILGKPAAVYLAEMFNKQLSGINKRLPNAAASSMEIDESDTNHLTDAGRQSGYKLYHPNR